MLEKQMLIYENKNFVETEYLKKISERAAIYLKSGLPVHFCGPAGVGKTSLALRIAKNLDRPYSFLFGNNDFNTSDLIGGNYGYRRRKTVDNFIHNVYTVEEDFQLKWLDRQLVKACREGHTLIYDEFSRTRPTVNNIFLSILEEGILFLPSFELETQYVKVHPEFRLIFTSNPNDYAGIHQTQNALEDRMVTIWLTEMDHETEVAITVNNSGLDEKTAFKVVSLVREYRTGLVSSSCSVRSSIKIAKSLSKGDNILSNTGLTISIFSDILFSEIGQTDSDRNKLKNQISLLVEKYF